MSSNSPELEDVLLFDPPFIDPGQPTGFWFCADPEDVLAVQVNAGCIRSDAGWEALGRFEAFFLRFCHVVVVCADPDRRAVMVRELRQRLPNVILLAVEDRGFHRCRSVRELRDTYGLKEVDRMLLDTVEIPAYGLLDLAGLPAGSTWQTAQEIGTLLYENAQPAPELSVFMLGEEPIQSWAQQGGELYRRLKALEQTAGVHCGLQQLFTNRDVCAVPALSEGAAYDFVLLPREGPAMRSSGMTAQLAAVLCGQTTRMEGTYAFGAVSCRVRAQVTVEENRVQLHLREGEYQCLSGTMEDPEGAFYEELRQAFAELCRGIEENGTDPFSLGIWQFCTYGTEYAKETPVLEILPE